MEQQQNQQKRQGYTCTGDCLKCHPTQRQYCAAQFTYNSMRMLERMEGSLVAMQGTINELTAKVEAIQGNEAALFDPTADSPSNETTEPKDNQSEVDGGGIPAEDAELAKPQNPLFLKAQ